MSVEVRAYNSKFYYVQGDVAAPGRMPCSGRETVLDVINFAGGLLATADPGNLRLVRPARGGKPLRVYAVDLKAITERGDTKQNYQLFPGDRLVVGRNPVVQAAAQIDRVAGLTQTLANSALQASFMTRTLATATPDLTPAQREELFKGWIDASWSPTGRPADLAAERAALRDLLLRLVQAARPAIGTTGPPAGAIPSPEKK